MIQARHTCLGACLGRLYAGYKLSRAFPEIRLIGEPPSDSGAVLLIANHFSWWDGFIQYRLNREVFKKKFFVMMREDQLIKNRVLNQGGAFSVRKGSRHVVESLRYTARLLADPRNLVLLFPQGEIQSIYTAPFHFQKGLGYLLKQTPENRQLIFNVNLIDYFSDKRPSLSVYYRPYEGSFDLPAVEQAFNAYAEACKQQQ